MHDSEQLKPAFEEACRALTEAIKDNDIDERSKLSVQTVSAYSKLKSTERAGATLQYLIIRDFAEDNAEEIKKLVQSSIPEYAPKQIAA